MIKTIEMQNGCFVHLTGIWQATIFMAAFMLAGCASVAGAQDLETVTAPTAPLETRVLLLPETDYCTMTNALALMERIVEWRCLLSVLAERSASIKTSADAIERADLSDGDFTKDVQKWLVDILAYSEDNTECVKLKMSFDLMTIALSTGGIIAGRWITYEEHVGTLREDERYRFLSRKIKYKAKLYSLISEKFVLVKKSPQPWEDPHILRFKKINWVPISEVENMMAIGTRGGAGRGR